MKKAHVKVGTTYRAKVSNKVVEVRIDGESPHGGWNATNMATGKAVRIKSAQRLRPGTSAEAEGAANGAGAAAVANAGGTAAPVAKEGEPTAAPAPGAKDATRANGGQTAAKGSRRHKVVRGDGKVVHVTAPGADEAPPGPAATNPAIKATEKARKEAIKVADANIAAIEAAESGTAAKGAKGKKAKPDFGKAAKPTFPEPKRTSAIDAAAQLLARAKEPMRCKDMIETMAAKGLWQSPGGKTPAATLNAAIIREIAKKGADARFVRAGRGLFAASSKGGK